MSDAVVDLGRERWARRSPSPASVDDCLTAWRLQEGRPQLLLDRELRLLWTNPAAEAVLAREDGLRRVSGRLACRDCELQSRLESAAADDTSVTVLALPLDAEQWLMLKLERVTAPDGRIVIGVTLQVAGDESAWRWADLTEVFGLTPAEALITRRLIEGLSAEEVAIERGSSLETIRTHIRRLYAKLGIGGRERLFARAGAMRMR